MPMSPPNLKPRETTKKEPVVLTLVALGCTHPSKEMQVNGNSAKGNLVSSDRRMSRKPIRLVMVWLFALALVAPSLGACVCAVGCEMGSSPTGCDPHCHETPEVESHHGGDAKSPSGMSHAQYGDCEANGGCGCALGNLEATIPSHAVVSVLHVVPLVFFFEPAPEFEIEEVSIELPGFCGYDSGPPGASLRLPVHDRSPPVLRA